MFDHHRCVDSACVGKVSALTSAMKTGAANEMLFTTSIDVTGAACDHAQCGSGRSHRNRIGHAVAMFGLSDRRFDRWYKIDSQHALMRDLVWSCCESMSSPRRCTKIAHFLEQYHQGNSGLPITDRILDGIVRHEFPTAQLLAVIAVGSEVHAVAS